MPDVLTPYCDHPKCGNVGVRVKLQIDGGPMRTVILCQEHLGEDSIKAAVEYSRAAKVTPIGKPRQTGTNRARLKAIRVED